jgi:protein dithiol oxidoreductase (disulfide-forming)
MKPFRALLLSLMLLPLAAQAQMRWQEGRQYTRIPGNPATTAPAGKIAVTEAFSYACIHCANARHEMAKLAASLPRDAVMTYVHASFRPDEAWPMFQRAFYTAQSLGIAEATHEQMFAAVWETGEVALLDRTTRAVRRPLPTIEEAARFYAKYSSVKAADFLKLANSAEITAQMQRTDALIEAWRIGGTPTVVVNGRYQVDNNQVTSWDEFRQLVNYLVNLERARLKQSATPKP